MSTPTHYFTTDHRRCDTLWSEVEAAADASDQPRLAAAFEAFAAATERHFHMEEEVLFPAFEAATGMSGGPTMVMRMEHVQIRGLLSQLATLVTAGAHRRVLDLGDTLLMLVQQHNAKEEAMLYPMADRAVGHHWEEIRAELAAY